MRGQRHGKVRKACIAFKLTEEWKKTALAKRRAIQKKRANLTDFERFQVMSLRKKLSL